MDSRTIWTAFFWRDYIADTRSLTNAQRGMYIDLMAEYYITGKPLVANATVLLQLCQAHAEADKSALQDVLDRFFKRDGDVYRHKRIDLELAKSIDLSNKRRAAGSIGGQAKAAKETKNPSNCHDFASVLPEQPLTQSQAHTQEVLKTPAVKSSFDPREVELPDWIPRDSWVDFVEMRRQKREPVTKISCSRLISRLDELRQQGHSPIAVIDQSITNGWKGFFAIKGGYNGGTANYRDKITREVEILEGIPERHIRPVS